MSKFYKNKRSATSAFFRENGFFIVLSVSMLVLCCVALLLFYPVTPDESLEGNTDTQTGSTSSLQENPGGDTDVGGTISSIPYDSNTDTQQNTDTDSEQNISDTDVDSEEEPSDRVWYLRPVSSAVDREFSGTAPVFSETMQDWRVHQGVDFFTPSPEDVCAVADGIVENVYTGELMGVTVEIRHDDGSLSIYQSLEENPQVIKGMAVKAGDVIGRTGTTAEAECLDGYHLHFAVLENGSYQDPADRWND